MKVGYLQVSKFLPLLDFNVFGCGECDLFIRLNCDIGEFGVRIPFRRWISNNYCIGFRALQRCHQSRLISSQTSHRAQPMLSFLEITSDGQVAAADELCPGVYFVSIQGPPTTVVGSLALKSRLRRCPLFPYGQTKLIFKEISFKVAVEIGHRLHQCSAVSSREPPKKNCIAETTSLSGRRKKKKRLVFLILAQGFKYR